jgi:hypothetical protein
MSPMAFSASGETVAFVIAYLSSWVPDRDYAMSAGRTTVGNRDD